MRKDHAGKRVASDMPKWAGWMRALANLDPEAQAHGGGCATLYVTEKRVPDR